MSLARAWRRQLYGASSAALIVPFAMLAALLVLALGGGFGQVGVLGQIFAGPPAPSVAGGGAGTAARPLPVIPAATVLRDPARPGGGAGTRSARRRAGVVPVASAPVLSRGPSQTGGAVGGAAPVVSQPVPVVGQPVPVGSKPVPAAPQPAPAGSPSSSSSGPSPSPKPRPTPVDQIVNAITPITEQVPAPAGPAVTQAVQAAGSAADGVLPPGVGSGPPAQGLKLP